MSSPSPFLLYQIADSAFPTGGFAHSGGLEAASQLGALAGEGALDRFIIASLDQTGHGSLPLVRAAHAVAGRSDAPFDLDAIGALDALAEASLTGHVGNRASRAQGRALIATAAASFDNPALAALRARLRAGGLHGHLAPVFGFVLGALEVPRDEAERLFLFQHLRGLVSAAVRLSLVGPLAAQALQHRLGERAASVLARCQDLTLTDLAQTAPLLELFQGHHDRLYSRLFSS